MGSNWNHFLEWPAALCLCAGIGWTKLTRIRPRVLATVAGLAATAWLCIFLWRERSLPFNPYATVQDCSQAYAFVKQYPGDQVLSENVGALVLAGKTVWVSNPFVYTQLVMQYLMTFTGSTINFGIAVIGGVIVGSFLMAMATGSFTLESFVDRNDLMRHLGGAMLMGAGGVLALGCTIGQGITGMSTLALGSLLAWLSILGGGYLGIRYLEEGSFGGALRAVFARG